MRCAAWRRHRGLRLWWWPFYEFREILIPSVWTALCVWRTAPANQPLYKRFNPVDNSGVVTLVLSRNTIVLRKSRW
jgi:hypothetical protein